MTIPSQGQAGNNLHNSPKGRMTANLSCRINAAFRKQLERRIYAAEPGAGRNRAPNSANSR
jgi:hypothetical protein